MEFTNIDELREYLETEIYNLVMEWWVCAANGSSAMWTEKDAEVVTNELISLFSKNKQLL